MKHYISLTMLICFATFSFAQHSFEDNWTKVEKLERDGLTKSASKLVDTIYNNAIKTNNQQQQIKALLFSSKYMLILEEEAQLNIVNNFKSKIKETNSIVTKHLLENMLATMYWQYFQQNRYQFYNRTKASEKLGDDFRTWDLETLFYEIHKYYQRSLQNRVILQLEKLETYSMLLNEAKDSKRFRPSLYDLLCHNALQFYKTTENSITQPSYQFKIEDASFASNSDQFIDLDLTSKDSLSLQLQALKIYQNLIKFHKKNWGSEAFVMADIERLKYVTENATYTDKSQVLEQTLKSKIKEIKSNSVSALYEYELARVYFQRGQQYNNNSDRVETKDSNRWKLKEALELCTSIITNYPDSDAAKQCQVLKDQIEQPNLRLQAEEHIPINWASRILVNYRNLDQLNFNIYKIDRNQLETYNKSYNSGDQVRFFKNLDPVKSFTSNLKTEGDYQDHSTEVIIPALANGLYLIKAETNSEDNVFVSTHIQVTNLALIETIQNDFIQYQLIDRTNGTPIEGAVISLNYRNNRNKYYNKMHSTDAFGMFQFNKDRNFYRSVEIRADFKDDVAFFGDANIGRKYDRTNKNTLQNNVYLFTDRGIYRPGQTVYFKGIATETRNGNTEVLANENAKIELRNVNGEVLNTLELKTNDFGSVSGEFILPNDGLTGNFSIEMSCKNSGYTYFSVEEYKRPKFKPEFKPVTETFKVNDSITVKGTAIAFAGSNITNAKVVYRVKRQVQYPSWWYWRRPSYYSSEAQEITFGEGKTNAKGEFEITFKAIPDASVSKDQLPIFNYEVTADITDINGETRTARTRVSVGYHAMTLNIIAPQSIDKSKKEIDIEIVSKNLNGEVIPASGTLSVYKLDAPAYVLRPRPWNAPDYQVIPKEEFKRMFPHESYHNEHLLREWTKGKKVFSINFDTDNATTISLKKLKKWTSGKYIIIAESQDKFGQDVKDEVYTSIYSDADKTVADQQLFTATLNKASYQPGDLAKLTLGSAAKDIAITVEVEKDGIIFNRQLVKLNNSKATVSIPVLEGDVGGFQVHTSLAAFNSYLPQSFRVNVPYPKTDLEIETSTFRDKLQPGQEETWSFKIKGPQSDKVTAELLASMYDASLDEFKAHNWSFNPIQRPSYYGRINKNSRYSFGNTNFRQFNYFKRISNISPQSYDQLNWFGFSFDGSHYYMRRQYIRSRFINTPSYFSSSQQPNSKAGIIKGTVIDEEDRLPLPGVSIIIKGKSTGTQTDFDGNFELEAKKGDIISVSYIGMKPLDISISEDNTYKINLVPEYDALDEVVVVGYGTTTKKAFTGSAKTVSRGDLETQSFADVSEALEGEAAGVTVIDGSGQPGSTSQIRIRGFGSVNGNRNPLYVVNGEIFEGDISSIDENTITKLTLLKDAEAVAIYGERGKNGVLLIETGGALQNIPVRKNLNETAFFFPHLQTNKNGQVSFNFTAPEALTRWKLQLLAHTKTLESAVTQLEAVTQKELMVIPNAPRFLREGDQITISTKIANLTDKELSGIAQLLLTDAISGQSLDTDLNNSNNQLSFNIDANGNTQVSWSLDIPEGIQAVEYKVIAKSGEFSDGEQNALPVLSNRMLVTETMPMWIRSNESKTFTLDKLKNNKSTSLTNHRLTLEMTSNPAWYAVQALPYLMEYPYDCNEQTFARYYSNTLAQHIVKSNPKIEAVFNQWKTQEALISNLEKNQELKSLLIQETPWLRDAQSETEQKKRIGLLFDLNKMNTELNSALRKLKQNQLPSGAWPWFNGGYANRYITQHIIGGFGHLKQLNVSPNTKEMAMIQNAFQYLDDKFIEEYYDLKKYNSDVDLSKDHLSYMQLHYLYVRSFYPEIKASKEVEQTMEYYKSQIKKYWLKRSLYAKGLMSLTMHRMNDDSTAAKILRSLKENSISSDELGMYWKSNTNSWYWYQAPIETQALLIEAFSEVGNVIQNDANNLTDIDNLKIWLLKNKQTNQWKTTKATTEAVYALLLQGSSWLDVSEMVAVKVGNTDIGPKKLEDVKHEAGTGYYKTSWTGSDIKPEQAEVQLTKKGDGIAWGALYWQYFEDLDKITTAETPLKLSKKLFLKSNTDKGEEISEITLETKLNVGDLVRVRIELRTDRSMEFVHLKDMRAAGFEPINVLSQYKWQDGLGYYESTKDAATNFFIDYLPKGVYVFEYDLRVNNSGNMSNGISTIQSMYAPEYSSHSEGMRISVN